METWKPAVCSWQVRPKSEASYMPGPEAMQRLARVPDDGVPPLQLIRSRYGLTLAFEDGNLVNPKLRGLHRLGIRSCRLKNPASLERPLVLGDRLNMWQDAFSLEIGVIFNGKRTEGVDRASTRWMVDRIENHSPLLSGTVIQASGVVRVLVARNVTMGKLRGEKSLLD